MKKRTMILLSLMLVFALVVTGCASKPAEEPAAEGGEPIVLKLGHQAPAGTAYDNLALKFIELVETKSGGKYVIDVYNGGQLGGDRELMEALQVGNVAFNILTASDMGAFAPEMEVQDLPYLLENWDQVY